MKKKRKAKRIDKKIQKKIIKISLIILGIIILGVILYFSIAQTAFSPDSVPAKAAETLSPIT